VLVTRLAASSGDISVESDGKFREGDSMEVVDHDSGMFVLLYTPIHFSLTFQ
jgi:hypothetical protein